MLEFPLQYRRCVVALLTAIQRFQPIVSNNKQMVGVCDNGRHLAARDSRYILNDALSRTIKSAPLSQCCCSSGTDMYTRTLFVYVDVLMAS